MTIWMQTNTCRVLNAWEIILRFSTQCNSKPGNWLSIVEYGIHALLSSVIKFCIQSTTQHTKHILWQSDSASG